MRVLVVEDNALLRHHLKVQIQDAGHQVDDAEDAKEAELHDGSGGDPGARQDRDGPSTGRGIPAGPRNHCNSEDDPESLWTNR